MNSTLVRPARSFALVLAAAGIAAMGSVGLAPAASAAPAKDAPSYILEAPGTDSGNGVDAFIVTDTGRVPVFFCEDDKAKHDKGDKAREDKAKEDKAKHDKEKKAKHGDTCTPTGEGDGGRF
jgi:hypothetical protein